MGILYLLLPLTTTKKLYLKCERITKACTTPPPPPPPQGVCCTMNVCRVLPLITPKQPTYSTTCVFVVMPIIFSLKMNAYMYVRICTCMCSSMLNSFIRTCVTDTRQVQIFLYVLRYAHTYVCFVCTYVCAHIHTVQEIIKLT